VHRTAALIRRFSRRLVGQAGFALPITIGVSLVLGISGTTSMIYSTENSRGAASSKADERAFSLAEAGLNYAYATLYNAPDPTMPGAVPQRSEPAEDGTITWWGTLETQTNVWTLAGRGTVPNPAGGAAATRTVRARARVTRSSRGTANNAVWNYIYAEAPTSCTTLSNTVNVNVPFYVKGNLCLRNSAQVSGTNTVLRVGGTLTLENSATAGTALSMLAEIHLGGGCRLGAGPITLNCGPAQSVFGTVVDNTPTNLVKPPVDLDYWYANAKPGPSQACTSGSFPGGFDNDGTLNRSLTQAVNLTPASAYDCQVLDAQGNLVGRLSWMPGSPGLLTIAGTIFFDGNILLENSVNAVYAGRATIYAAGTITMTNSVYLCGVAGCDSSWQPDLNLLALVAGSSTDQVGFSVSNYTTFQGAIYVVNDYSESNNTNIWGPIIARQVSFANSTTNHYVPLGTLLGGMPQSSEEAVSISNEPGSWG